MRSIQQHLTAEDIGSIEDFRKGPQKGMTPNHLLQVGDAYMH